MSEQVLNKIVSVINSCRTLDQVDVTSNWLMKLTGPNRHGLSLMGLLLKRRMQLTEGVKYEQ